jgi:hypothetical protein
MKVRKALRNIIVGVLVVLTFSAIFPLVWKYSGLRKKEAGWGADYLQVLVITPEEVEIIHSKGELDEFTKAHPNYSFLVPLGQQKRINEQLVALYRRKYQERGIDSFPWVKVEQIDKDRQLLEVGLSGDPSELVVWYEATDKEVFPRHHQRFGAISGLMMVCLTTGLTALLWIGLFAAQKQRLG